MTSRVPARLNQARARPDSLSTPGRMRCREIAQRRTSWRKLARSAVGPPTGKRRGVAGAHRARRRLPARRALRLDPPHQQPHLAAGAGHGRPVPDQPLRLPLRADHRLEPGEDRRRRQHPRRAPLPREPRRLRHPQRDPHGAPGPARHHPHPHGCGPGGVGARLRAAAAQPERHALLQAHRLSRVRRRGATISTSASASSPISATTSA